MAEKTIELLSPAGDMERLRMSLELRMKAPPASSPMGKYSPGRFSSTKAYW